MDVILEVGGRTAYVHTGGVELESGRPPVVLVHGAAHDHAAWRFVTRRLAHAGVPVAAVDLPGHGRTPGPSLESIGDMARWVLDVIDAMHAPSAVIAGHSMGSYVAIEAAVIGGDRVDAIVPIATATAMGVHPELQQAADLADPLAARLIAGWSHSGADRFGGHLQAGTWTLGLTVRMVERHLDVLAGDLRACAAYPAGERAELVGCPATVVVGSADKMTPARSGIELAARIPGGSVFEIDDAGHSMLEDHGEVVVATIRRVVTAVPSP